MRTDDMFGPDNGLYTHPDNLTNEAPCSVELINPDGSGLERVTYSDGFDGFPMFSPDGKKLVWASNRNAKVPHETNIFIGDWVP